MFRELSGFESHIKGNIVVAQFVNKAGELKTKAFTTVNNEIQIKALGYDKLGVNLSKKVHSENIMLRWLEANGIDFKNVIGIFSELQPCILEAHNCADLLKRNFPNTKIEFSYIYPGLEGTVDGLYKVRNASVNLLEKKSREFFKLNK
jgi:hypothetical protein